MITAASIGCTEAEFAIIEQTLITIGKGLFLEECFYDQAKVLEQKIKKSLDDWKMRIEGI